jgi:hypothetical protein
VSRTLSNKFLTSDFSGHTGNTNSDTDLHKNCLTATIYPIHSIPPLEQLISSLYPCVIQVCIFDLPVHYKVSQLYRQWLPVMFFYLGQVSSSLSPMINKTPHMNSATFGQYPQDKSWLFGMSLWIPFSFHFGLCGILTLLPAQ